MHLLFACLQFYKLYFTISTCKVDCSAIRFDCRYGVGFIKGWYISQPHRTNRSKTHTNDFDSSIQVFVCRVSFCAFEKCDLDCMISLMKRYSCNLLIHLVLGSWMLLHTLQRVNYIKMICDMVITVLYRFKIYLYDYSRLYNCMHTSFDHNFHSH